MRTCMAVLVCTLVLSACGGRHRRVTREEIDASLNPELAKREQREKRRQDREEYSRYMNWYRFDAPQGDYYERPPRECHKD
jgi:hypothetical protein